MLETSKIELHGDISIPFLKKSRFTGSFKGICEDRARVDLGYR